MTDSVLLIWLSGLTCVTKLTQLSLNGNLEYFYNFIGTLTGRSVLITALSSVARNDTQHSTELRSELRSAFCPQVPRRLAVRWQHETMTDFSQE